jgi:cytochrome c oxidase subunit 2
MSVTPPDKHWWDTPIHTKEKIWLTTAFAWSIVLTVAMPAFHIWGEHNASTKYSKVTNQDYDILTDRFVAKYKVGEEKGVTIVAPPPKSDIYLRGKQWGWDPILKLKAGETYQLHLSSVDVNHGFSVFPINMNFQVVPGWDNLLTVTPTKAGMYTIICNEFCGIGHHTMIGKIYVE